MNLLTLSADITSSDFDFGAYLTSPNGLIEDILIIVWYAVLVVAFWKIFKKAGQPGWVAIIPGYNLFMFYKIAKGSGWYMFMLFIPLFGIFYHIGVVYRFCLNFGKGKFFSVMAAIFMFPLIFIAFDKSEYTGPARPTKRR